MHLSDGRREPVATGLGPAFFLTWLDATHSALLTPLRDPVNSVIRIDTGTGAVATIDAGVPARPSSVAVTTTKLLICSNDEIDSDDLTPYSSSGPILLGIGHVPADKVVGGLATTDPGYFFSATEAPFGGSLPVMVNHAGARSAGRRTTPSKSTASRTPSRSTTTGGSRSRASSYCAQPHPQPAATTPSGRPESSGTTPTSARSTTRQRVPTAATPSPSGSGPPPPQAARSGPAADPGRSVTITVNNLWPRVRINQISKNGTPVPVCGIVQLGTSGGSTGFTFDVTADSVGGYLDTWALTAVWGADKSAGIASDAYAAHAPGPWTGSPAPCPAAAGLQRPRRLDLNQLRPHLHSRRVGPHHRRLLAPALRPVDPVDHDPAVAAGVGCGGV